MGVIRLSFSSFGNSPNLICLLYRLLRNGEMIGAQCLMMNIGISLDLSFLNSLIISCTSLLVESSRKIEDCSNAPKCESGINRLIDGIV